MNDLSVLVGEKPASAGQAHRIVAIHDPMELVHYVPLWEQLVDQAAEPNVFYTPWALIPAIHHLSNGQAVRVLLFFRDGEGTVLDGVLPLFEKRCIGPFVTLHGYRHRYCFSAEPLVCRGREREVAASFVAWLSRRRLRYPLLTLRGLDVAGVWYQALSQAMQVQGVQYHQTEPVQRALLQITDGGLDVFQERIPAKKRKEYARLKERLAQLGELQIDVLAPEAADLHEWLDDFIALELKGWKGREGTALGSRPECRLFFERIARAAHERGQLVMARMRVGGRPVAMLCDLLAPPGRYAFKTAYDEDFSRYAPGVLLEIENAHLTFQSPRGVEWLDSCAAPDNALLNRLYPHRRTLVDITVCARAVAHAGLWLKQLRQKSRRAAS